MLGLGDPHAGECIHKASELLYRLIPQLLQGVLIMPAQGVQTLL
jgi:hypothetical protein